MVEISPIEESTPPIASKERFLDADEIESLLHQVKRPSVKAHLEALATKIRKDGQALERVEASQVKAETNEGKESNPTEESSTARVPTTTNTAQTKIHTAPISIGSNLKYKSIDRFSFDLGSYNSSHITIYIPLQEIGQHSKDKIHCKFTKESFDLTIDEFEGVNHRLVKDNLDKNIDPTTSKMIIKANKIIIKLGKVKNEYGYESWTDLTSKKSKETKKQMEKDPQASIMNLMKEMYDSGDDNMKKMIGETMLKQREGKLDKPDLGSMDDAF